MWILSSNQRKRLEHAHALRLAIPIPVAIAQRDEAYVRSTLIIPERANIVSVRRAELIVHRGHGTSQTGMDGLYGQIDRDGHIPSIPPLTILVLIAEITQTDRDPTAYCPVQWAIWSPK